MMSFLHILHEGRVGEQFRGNVPCITEFLLMVGGAPVLPRVVGLSANEPRLLADVEQRVVLHPLAFHQRILQESP